jgi:hypothetical protein
MPVHIGPDDLERFADPRPDLLARLSGITPEAGGFHVLLQTQSTQRLALSEFRGGLIAAIWPAELKEQSTFVYTERRAQRMLAAARDRGWITGPALQFAFRNSAPSQRLYIRPEVDASVFTRVWERDGFARIGRHDSVALRQRVWPWLKQLGWVDDEHDAVLDKWIDERLGRRPGFVRPGLRIYVHRRGDPASLIDGLRSDLEAIFASVGEIPLRQRTAVSGN